MAIGIQSSLPFHLVEETSDGFGRSLLVKGLVLGLMITLMNVYLHNQGQIWALQSAFHLLLD